MLNKWVPHEKYQRELWLKLMQYCLTQKGRVQTLDASISKLYLLNLDPLLPIIKPLYSDYGRLTKNQQGIIRSLVLMLAVGNHSITNWACTVATDELLFDLCGFDSINAPNIASYYDFLIRLWLMDHAYYVDKKNQTRSFERKPNKKLKSGEKQPPKHPGIIKTLVDKAIEGKLPDLRPEVILQNLLARCCVDPSAMLGLLGDIKSFSTSFDGSPFYSGASHYGVKVCDCKSKGIYNCHCARRYSDPDAKWGWDSYRECWYYGDTLFSVTASDSKNDLPIYIQPVQGSRHDGVTTVFALRNIQKMFPLIMFKHFIADGAMDSYPIYKLLDHYKMIPFIPIDSRTKKNLSFKHPAIKGFTSDGNPVCPGSYCYTYWGYTYPYRHKYRCPFSTMGLEPPVECKCSDSNYGRTIYIKSDSDPRLFPPVPRHTETFKKMMNTRTSSERLNKRIFCDYDVEDAASRSTMMRFSMATFAAVNIHLDAWIKHMDFSIFKELTNAVA